MTRILDHRIGTASAPVHVGSGTLVSAGSLIASALAGHSTTGIVVVADEAIDGANSWAASVIASIKAEPTFTKVHLEHVSLHASERSKSVAQWQSIMDRSLAAGLDRHGLIVAIGGGIATDLAGFVAATYMRGVSWVAVPTTLLGMVDSALGGKTAINLPLPRGGLGKNLAGAFWPPAAVLCDVQTLSTLPARQIRAGLAECLKHSMIADHPLGALLAGTVECAASLDAADQWKLVDLVSRSAKVKLDIVAKDEREAGVRRHLNLGHTFAHAFEAHCCDQLLHGEAVAIGLVAAAAASGASGRLTAEEASAIKERVASLGLPTMLPTKVPTAMLLDAARSDKKSRGGRLLLVLPRREGGVEVVSDDSDRLFAAGIAAVSPP